MLGRGCHRIGEKPAVLPIAAPRPLDPLPRLRFLQPLGDDAMPPHAVAERFHDAQLQAEHRAEANPLPLGKLGIHVAAEHGNADAAFGRKPGQRKQRQQQASGRQ